MRVRFVVLTVAGAVVCVGLALAGSSLRAANPRQQSLAEASRKALQQKREEPAKKVKVYTNDDLEALKNAPVSIVGQPEPAESSGAASAFESAGDKTAAASSTGAASAESPAAKTPAANQPQTKGEAYFRQKFAEARRNLADDQKELDIDQRELNLKLTQFYTDPNASLMQQYSRSDINQARSAVDKKKQDVAKDQQAISDLEQELRQAGGDPGWER